MLKKMVQYPNKLVRTSFPHADVLLLEMNRPKVNALNNALWAEVGECADLAHNDPDVRCVVLASALDKIFTAGLDLSDSSLDIQSDDPGRWALRMREHIKELQDSVSALERCDKPIIAAVHGGCYGGGLDIIAACDVRYAAKGTVFSIKEVDVGLAADVGSLQRLPWKTGNDSYLRELALTARNFGCDEAEKLGLISKAVEGGRQGVIDAAVEVAKDIASKSPIATLGTKHVMNYNTKRQVEAGLEYVRAWNMSMLQSEDLVKAFQAFAAKKPAKYSKL